MQQRLEEQPNGLMIWSKKGMKKVTGFATASTKHNLVNVSKIM